MFEGRRYTQKGGYKSNAVRFADEDGGVCTTAYNYSMCDDDRYEMAARIAAALDLTTNLSTEEMQARMQLHGPLKSLL